MKTSLYKFSVRRRWLTMPDGIKLAATLYFPRGAKGEKFPVVLEYLPYRKDDTFYVVDHQCFSYFAQLGFIAVKVDIRGTGSSEGVQPEREYSDTEMSDCQSIIEELAALPTSNGNVGMFGTSWSGFNAIQMAMRRPPALKAINAIHSSDDLYHDDLHFIDGNLHLDPYHLFINHELGLPPTPDYILDDQYFAQRFDRRPWLFTYIANQLDGPFWREKSLREDYSQIDIPVYLIGGLLDGYRTAAVRMFGQLSVPVRCDIGPWEHSCPDDGSPGPNYEWQKRLGQWFNRYLRDDKSGHKAPQKEFMVYVRSGHAPDAAIENVPGYWRKDTMPALGTRRMQYRLTPGGRLVARGKDKNVNAGSDDLIYHPFAGTAAGTWWGNRTGDMSGDDAYSLCYDSQPLTRPKEIIGLPSVTVKVKSTSAKAKWTVRLEDVAPDGKVMLVTGGLFNPAQAADRLNPVWPEADKQYTIEVPLHFTTWTFQPGHKIRVAIANAQFPMAWPSPEAMTATVFSGEEHTCLTLPVVPAAGGERPRLPRVADKLYSPDSEGIDFPGKPDAAITVGHDKKSGRQSYRVVGNSAYKIRNRRYFVETSNTWSTFDGQPWRAKYLGVARTTIVSQGLNIRVRTHIEVESDEHNFYVSLVRTLTRNGKVVRRKRFSQTIARQFQ